METIKAYTGDKPYLFVSYAHADAAAVMEVLEALQEQGFRIWYDEGIEVGSDWSEFIAGRLAGSGLMLAFLSKSYIPSAPQRMDMYKRIARVENEADYDDILDELCDRYGEPNAAAVNLCRIARIRALGRDAGFSKIEERDGSVRLYTSEINPSAVQRLALTYPSLGVKVSLSQNPFITLKTKQNERNTEFLIELLTKYTSFLTA